MRLEKLLGTILPWRRQQLNAHRVRLARLLIPDSEIERWKVQGILIQRGCSVSNGVSIAIVKIIPRIESGAVEFRVPYQATGHAMHELKPATLGHLRLKVRPKTSDDLLELIEVIVAKRKMLPPIHATAGS